MLRGVALAGHAVLAPVFSYSVAVNSLYCNAHLYVSTRAFNVNDASPWGLDPSAGGGGVSANETRCPVEFDHETWWNLLMQHADAAVRLDINKKIKSFLSKSADDDVQITADNDVQITITNHGRRRPRHFCEKNRLLRRRFGSVDYSLVRTVFGKIGASFRTFFCFLPKKMLNWHRDSIFRNLFFRKKSPGALVLITIEGSNNSAALVRKFN
jgi:hypothetical protein